tara:strand:- start:264 stop:512 length:249 start_codon:yes stop_codon:yes gene_type:complete
LAELAWVSVADPSTLAETYKFAKAVEALAVVGMNNIIDPLPTLSSVSVVVVALAVKVSDPVLLTLPPIVLFRATEIMRKWAA